MDENILFIMPSNDWPDTPENAEKVRAGIIRSGVKGVLVYDSIWRTMPQHMKYLRSLDCVLMAHIAELSYSPGLTQTWALLQAAFTRGPYEGPQGGYFDELEKYAAQYEAVRPGAGIGRNYLRTAVTYLAGRIRLYCPNPYFAASSGLEVVGDVVNALGSADQGDVPLMQFAEMRFGEAHCMSTCRSLDVYRKDVGWLQIDSATPSELDYIWRRVGEGGACLSAQISFRRLADQSDAALAGLDVIAAHETIRRKTR